MIDWHNDLMKVHFVTSPLNVTRSVWYKMEIRTGADVLVHWTFEWLKVKVTMGSVKAKLGVGRRNPRLFRASCFTRPSRSVSFAFWRRTTILLRSHGIISLSFPLALPLTCGDYCNQGPRQRDRRAAGRAANCESQIPGRLWWLWGSLTPAKKPSIKIQVIAMENL